METFEQKIEELRIKKLAELSPSEIEFLKARRSYLTVKEVEELELEKVEEVKEVKKAVKKKK